MTTFAQDRKRLSEIIEPKTLSHSDWLWALGEEKLFTPNIRKRLGAIALLIGRRPDINTTGDFQFEVGATYPTLAGKLVTIVKKTTTKGYECVVGSDKVARYNRSGENGCADIGRVTGSDGDDKRNLIPLRIIDAGPLERTQNVNAKSMRDETPRDLIKAKVTNIQNWDHTPKVKFYSVPEKIWRLKPGQKCGSGHNAAGDILVYGEDGSTLLVAYASKPEDKFWVSKYQVIGRVSGTSWHSNARNS